MFETPPSSPAFSPAVGGVSGWDATQQGVRRAAQTFRQRGGVGGLGRLRVEDRLADAYGDAPPPLVQKLAEQEKGAEPEMQATGEVERTAVAAPERQGDDGGSG